MNKGRAGASREVTQVVHPDDLDVDGCIDVIEKAKLEEGSKLEQLCWDNGIRPTENGLNRILERFSDLVKDHLEIADIARLQGRLKAPKPLLEEKSTTWQRLLKAREVEALLSVPWLA